MLTSKPVFACLYVSFCFNVLMTLIHSYQPTFFKEVLYLKIMDVSLDFEPAVIFSERNLLRYSSCLPNVH
jgi:hypothetical protein